MSLHHLKNVLDEAQSRVFNLEYELFKATSERNCAKSMYTIAKSKQERDIYINAMKQNILFIYNMIENFMASDIYPEYWVKINLNGLHEKLLIIIDTYDDIFNDMYNKYVLNINVGYPEVKLFIVLFKNIMLTHITNEFSSQIPLFSGLLTTLTTPILKKPMVEEDQTLYPPYDEPNPTCKVSPWIDEKIKVSQMKTPEDLVDSTPILYENITSNVFDNETIGDLFDSDIFKSSQNTLNNLLTNNPDLINALTNSTQKLINDNPEFSNNLSNIFNAMLNNTAISNVFDELIKHTEEESKEEEFIEEESKEEESKEEEFVKEESKEDKSYLLSDILNNYKNNIKAENNHLNSYLNSYKKINSEGISESESDSDTESKKNV